MLSSDTTKQVWFINLLFSIANCVRLILFGGIHNSLRLWARRNEIIPYGSIMINDEMVQSECITWERRSLAIHFGDHIMFTNTILILSDTISINIILQAAWNFYDNQKSTSNSFSKDEQLAWNEQKKNVKPEK